MKFASYASGTPFSVTDDSDLGAFVVDTSNYYTVLQSDWNSGSLSMTDGYSGMLIPAAINTTSNEGDFLISLPNLSSYDSGSGINDGATFRIINQANLNGNMIVISGSAYDSVMNDGGQVFMDDVTRVKTAYPRLAAFGGWIVV